MVTSSPKYLVTYEKNHCKENKDCLTLSQNDNKLSDSTKVGIQKKINSPRIEE